MSDPYDAARSWQELVRLMMKAFGQSPPTRPATGLFEAMSRQFETMQRSLTAQADLYRQMSEHAFIPIVAMVKQFETAATTTKAAGVALKQAGQLLEEQAAAMEQGIAMLQPLREFLNEPRDQDTPG